jgi:hypothetical protein
MIDYKEQEVERPDFVGEEMYGIYSGGVWISLDPDVTYEFGKNSINSIILMKYLILLELPPPQKYYPSLLRKSKIVSSLPLIVTMVIPYTFTLPC